MDILLQRPNHENYLTFAALALSNAVKLVSGNPEQQARVGQCHAFLMYLLEQGLPATVLAKEKLDRADARLRKEKYIPILKQLHSRVWRRMESGFTGGITADDIRDVSVEAKLHQLFSAAERDPTLAQGILDAAPNLTDYLKEQLKAPLAILKLHTQAPSPRGWAGRVQATREGQHEL